MKKEYIFNTSYLVISPSQPSPSQTCEVNAEEAVALPLSKREGKEVEKKYGSISNFGNHIKKVS